VVLTLDNPLLRSAPAPKDRKAELSAPGALPAGLTVVSADGHWQLNEDIFHDRFPKHLRDRAPRVWFDGFWQMGDPNQTPTSGPAFEMMQRLRAVLEQGSSSIPAAWDLAVRARDLAAEGIDKEIVYPNSLIGFIRHPDLEVQELVYRIYNERIAEIGEEYRGRFYGVGVCSNWWDPKKARGAVQQIVDLGLKTFMVPTMNAGMNTDGRPISYGGEEMDVFWSAVADSGLPITFHVGENLSLSGRCGMATSVLQSMGSFRKPFAELVFGGVFDRHPDLQVVFAEGGISWVPTALQDAEATIDAQHRMLEYVPRQRPSQYWANNCYATFQSDLLGLRLLDYIGADRVMWANDYPHNEGTFGYSRSSMQQVVDAVTTDAARLILGDTASRVYRLD
jgi:predicted TIM-barrel fold metal-dependent hydrolase